ncbi:endonuclease/exonuclease/phosphatase family protein [Rhodobacteraceae bacterium B1Z28]|uniref:Endonuclease/exonuclease/phosphatase family protein n=1 Tax=Ruegeria haliotis TaxID=2747601 RepID=A0ABX2PRV4_9RHOB|nr:endonuclease/exonuclease/phosphatase family protein [Ruegeria haliotis]
MTEIVNALPAVTPGQRANILSAPSTAAAHRGLLQDIPAMNALQLGGTASTARLPAEFNVAAWNVERCLFPEATAAHLGQISPDIVLLSEVDHGMARTSQRHTAEVMATELGMVYAFGVEFLELDLGGPTERRFCKDDFNTFGWHGNAILSAVPFERTALIRLDGHGHWFAADEGAADPDQPRVGGRMAIAAVVPSKTGSICVVSTHLESNADAAHRHAQFDVLLNAIDAFASGLPVVIGGDLNTGNHLPPDFNWQNETLFGLAQTRGYSWDFTTEGPTTRPSLITPHPQRVMKLDWLAGRDLTCKEKGLLTSISDDGTPLSDHDCVWCRVG